MTRVRELRRRACLSQAELARRAGISLRTLYAVEQGRPCRLSTRRKILRGLGLDVSNAAQVWPT